MSLPLLQTIKRGESADLTFTLDLTDGTDVTVVSTMVGTLQDHAGLEANTPFALSQVGSTNVWLSTILPPWVATPDSARRQKWIVRVEGTVGLKSFADAGYLVVNNHR